MLLNFKNNVTECNLIYKYIKFNTKILKFQIKFKGFILKLNTDNRKRINIKVFNKIIIYIQVTYANAI